MPLASFVVSLSWNIARMSRQSHNCKLSIIISTAKRKYLYFPFPWPILTQNILYNSCHRIYCIVYCIYGRQFSFTHTNQLMAREAFWYGPPPVHYRFIWSGCSVNSPGFYRVSHQCKPYRRSRKSFFTSHDKCMVLWISTICGLWQIKQNR